MLLAALVQERKACFALVVRFSCVAFLCVAMRQDIIFSFADVLLWTLKTGPLVV